MNKIFINQVHLFFEYIGHIYIYILVLVLVVLELLTSKLKPNKVITIKD